MTGFLFLLAALAVIAIVATLRELPTDGLRRVPVDAVRLQHLRDRDDARARLDLEDAVTRRRATLARNATVREHDAAVAPAEVAVGMLPPSEPPARPCSFRPA